MINTSCCCKDEYEIEEINHSIQNFSKAIKKVAIRYVIVVVNVLRVGTLVIGSMIFFVLSPMNYHDIT